MTKEFFVFVFVFTTLKRINNARFLTSQSFVCLFFSFSRSFVTRLQVKFQLETIICFVFLKKKQRKKRIEELSTLNFRWFSVDNENEKINFSYDIMNGEKIVFDNKGINDIQRTRVLFFLFFFKSRLFFFLIRRNKIATCYRECVHK